MSRADLRKRIATLARSINPAGSLGYKIERLTDDQRRHYDKSRDCWAAYHTANPGEAAYANMIDGGAVPTLRRDVQCILFGVTDIPADTSIQDAAEAYRRFAFGD